MFFKRAVKSEAFKFSKLPVTVDTSSTNALSDQDRDFIERINHFGEDDFFKKFYLNLYYHPTGGNMSQNVHPFYPSQGASGKSREEKQSLPKDNHAVSKRLQKELMVLMMSAEKGISAFPEGENLFKWVATISGPLDTVYTGLSYKLTMEFPHSYPYSAPIVKFVTPCFHPNVDNSGNICLDILKDKWSALYDVRTILLSIQSLLGEPNNDSPLNAQAAELWSDQVKYKEYLTTEYQKVQQNSQDS